MGWSPRGFLSSKKWSDSDDPSGLVVEPDRQWQPLLITVGLWSLVGLAVLMSLVSFVAAGARQVEPVGDGPAAPGPDVTGVAERAVRAWLTGQTPPQVAGQVADSGGYGPNDVDRWQVGGLAVVQVAAVDDGYWAVVVAANLTDPATLADGDGTVGSVEWFLEVGVAETSHGAVVVASPAPVPALASRSGLVETATRPLTSIDPNDAQMATALDFVTSLLTGDEAVARYAAPGVDVTAALPPGVFTTVRPQRGSSTATDHGTVIRVEVVAESPAGTRMLFAYSVTVVDRDDRSEVTAFGATPPVTRTQGSPAPSGLAPTTTTTSTTAPSSTASTSPVGADSSTAEVPETAPSSASGSGLDGPYETVDRPGA